MKRVKTVAAYTAWSLVLFIPGAIFLFVGVLAGALSTRFDKVPVTL